MTLWGDSDGRWLAGWTARLRMHIFVSGALTTVVMHHAD